MSHKVVVAMTRLFPYLNATMLSYPDQQHSLRHFASMHSEVYCSDDVTLRVTSYTSLKFSKRDLLPRVLQIAFATSITISVFFSEYAS